jgi:hypothetical protein
MLICNSICTKILNDSCESLMLTVLFHQYFNQDTRLGILVVKFADVFQKEQFTTSSLLRIHFHCVSTA